VAGRGAGVGAGRRPGGLSLLMTYSDPQNIICTNSAQPRRIEDVTY